MTTTKNAPYLVMNSEYERFRGGKLLMGDDIPDWDNPPEEWVLLLEAGNWIGDLIRNWTESRKGGEFSLIKSACWLFTAIQEKEGGPVSLKVFTEFGRYRTDSEGGDAPDRLEVQRALDELKATDEDILYNVASLDRHSDYFLFEMTILYPAAKESLWSEMNRVSDALPDHKLLSELRNWIM